ncbi:MAG: 2-phospho-L-lactate transferase CofD family protein [Acidimicrobiia bacterium]
MRCILESKRPYFNHRVVLLAGGVGGARMARALRSVLGPGLLTVIANVGDNVERYGVTIAADPDTILYTLAGVVGPDGWGRENDTFRIMDELGTLGVDTTMRLGDKDFALCAYRTARLHEGVPLSVITTDLGRHFGIDDVTLLPASDDPVATSVQIAGGAWLDFQTYFVDRRHRDAVTAVAYIGSVEARPAPGVLEAIAEADLVIIAPSNPPLSIWPISAIEPISVAVAAHPNTAAVSPLFGGKPLKGPADAVMAGLGLAPSTEGVLDAYDGLIDALFVDIDDAADTVLGHDRGVTVHAVNTRLDPVGGPEVAATILTLMVS